MAVRISFGIDNGFRLSHAEKTRKNNYNSPNLKKNTLIVRSIFFSNRLDLFVSHWEDRDFMNFPELRNFGKEGRTELRGECSVGKS